ncbi:MAG TPA: OmpA family protein [Polyangiaceae bacterium]|jgi:peptidoglycan-associated lipoprotein
MKNRYRPLRQAVPLGIAVVLTGCAGDEPTHAVSPGVTAMQPREDHPTVVTTVLPNTPTASNVHISDEILRACNIPDADAYFAFDSSRLTDFDFPQLDQLASCFSSGPLGARSFSLVGHADPRGATEYNVTLGQSRADAVERYLEHRGVPIGRGRTSSRGALDATGHDETGWAHDRRVDVELL